MAGVCGLLAALLAACAAQPAATVNGQIAAGELLVPLQTLSSAPLAGRVDANGMPVPGTLTGFAILAFPSALAVRYPDMYIADSGSRKLYRYDMTARVMSIVPNEEAMPWTQVQAGMDRSLYVLDPAHNIIRHYSPGGQVLPSLSDPSTIASLDGFVVNEHGHEIIAADNLSGRLFTLSPLSGTAWPIGPFGHTEENQLPPLGPLGPLASNGDTIYAIDKNCACIIVIDEAGRVSARIGQGALSLPQSLAVDREGYIFVFDAADRTLKVFLQGKLLVGYEANKLGYTGINALAVDDDVLYLADGPGSKVLAFRINRAVEKLELDSGE